MSVISGNIRLISAIVDTLPDNTKRTGTVPVSLNPATTTSYSDGTTANKANRAYYSEFVLAVSTPLVLDLSALVCNDQSVGFTNVREILVFNDSIVDGQTIVVGGGTTPFAPDLAGTTPTMTVQASTSKRYVSKPLGATGHAVSTNINLKLDPGANTFAGRVLVLGN